MGVENTNVAQELAQRQSLINSANGLDGKASPLLACIIPGGGRDIQLASLKIPQTFLGKNLPTVAWGKQGKGDKLQSCLKAAIDEMSKIASKVQLVNGNIHAGGSGLDNSAVNQSAMIQGSGQGL